MEQKYGSIIKKITNNDDSESQHRGYVPESDYEYVCINGYLGGSGYYKLTESGEKKRAAEEAKRREHDKLVADRTLHNYNKQMEERRKEEERKWKKEEARRERIKELEDELKKLREGKDVDKEKERILQERIKELKGAPNGDDAKYDDRYQLLSRDILFDNDKADVYNRADIEGVAVVFKSGCIGYASNDRYSNQGIDAVAECASRLCAGMEAFAEVQRMCDVDMNDEILAVLVLDNYDGRSCAHIEEASEYCLDSKIIDAVIDASFNENVLTPELARNYAEFGVEAPSECYIDALRENQYAL